MNYINRVIMSTVNRTAEMAQRGANNTRTYLNERPVVRTAAYVGVLALVFSLFRRFLNGASK